MKTFLFDSENHLYTLDGRPLVSVTTALSLVDNRWKDPYYLQRGRFVHLACEFWDRGELDEESLEPEISTYLEGWKKFRTDTGFIPRLIEHRMYDEKWMLAGTLDREGVLNGHDVILDIKSGVPVPVDELQGAGYWYLFGRMQHKVFDLYLKDGSYKLREIERPKLLWPTFQAILQTYRWKGEHS